MKYKIKSVWSMIGILFQNRSNTNIMSTNFLIKTIIVIKNIP